jgi:hypothetical protein
MDVSKKKKKDKAAILGLFFFFVVVVVNLSIFCFSDFLCYTQVGQQKYTNCQKY